VSKARKDYLIPAPDDGDPAREVGRWAEEKYRRLGMYAEMFSTGMKNQWQTRVYIDLFAGSGHSRIRESHRRVLGSPLIALSLPDRFTKYIFCEQDASLLQALKMRAHTMAPTASVTCIEGDANARVSEIAGEIPRHSTANRVLSFCFADPVNLEIDFETVRSLGAGRAMDFLILFAFGMDATRNWATYLRPSNNRVEKFLGVADWRQRWKEAELRRVSETQFLATEYANAMTKLGYRTQSIEQMIPIRSTDRNLPLYYLAFFSKHEQGYKFWSQVQKYSADQQELALE
jgi:three-Cys-motif partner protein